MRTGAGSASLTVLALVNGEAQYMFFEFMEGGREGGRKRKNGRREEKRKGGRKKMK